MYDSFMHAHRLVPILNVTSFQESVAWFEKLGWKKAWDWHDPPSFGGVTSGACEIFLCEGGQGGRGRSPQVATFGVEGGANGDRGVWMCVWVEDVDAVHRRCQAQGIEVAMEPAEMPWGLREMHVRHPDGHILRIGQPVGK